MVGGGNCMLPGEVGLYFELDTTAKSAYYVNNYVPYQMYSWEGLKQQLHCTACVKEINYYKLMVISSRRAYN